MTTVIVNGAQGRMGRRITALAEADARFARVLGMGRGDAPPDISSGDIVIDFSSPEGARRAVAAAGAAGAALLVGTTGLDDETLGEIETCASRSAVMVAPNTSLGVAVLCHLVAEAARLLPARFDVDLVDRHHARKKDAPSGTALRIAAAMRDRGGRELPLDRCHALRGGDVVGEHEIQFAGDDQVVRISHAAGSRDVFARGALDAAAWLAGRRPGRYGIEDALGLRDPAPRRE